MRTLTADPHDVRTELLEELGHSAAAWVTIVLRPGPGHSQVTDSNHLPADDSYPLRVGPIGLDAQAQAIMGAVLRRSDLADSVVGQPRRVASAYRPGFWRALRLVLLGMIRPQARRRTHSDARSTWVEFLDEFDRFVDTEMKRRTNQSDGSDDGS